MNARQDQDGLTLWEHRTRLHRRQRMVTFQAGP